MVDVNVLEGWLIKEKSKQPRVGLLSDTNKRWFKVQQIGDGDRSEMALCYFKNQYSKEPKGWIYLQDVSEIIEDANAIAIISPSRRMKLRAQTRAEHRLWLQGLAQACPEAHAELQDRNLLESLRGDSAGGPRHKVNRNAATDGKAQDLDEERYNGTARDAYEEEAWNQKARRGRGDGRDPEPQMFRGTSYDAEEEDRWDGRNRRPLGHQEHQDFYDGEHEEADMGGGGGRRSRVEDRPQDNYDETDRAGGRGSRQQVYGEMESWNDNPRAGYDDRRGYEDRGGGYNERGGYDDQGGYDDGHGRRSPHQSERGAVSPQRSPQRSPQARRPYEREDIEEEQLPTNMRGAPRPSASPPRRASNAAFVNEQPPEPDPGAFEETKHENPYLEESKSSSEQPSVPKRKSIRKAKDVIRTSHSESMQSIDDKLTPQVGKFELEDSSDSDDELDLEAERKRLSENQARHKRNSLKATANVEAIANQDAKEENKQESKPARRKPPGPPPGKREKHAPAVVADKNFLTEDFDDDASAPPRKAKGNRKKEPTLSAQAKKEMEEDWDADEPPSQSKPKTKKKPVANVKEDTDWLDNDFDS